ncbi:hypothetical protein H632_c241p1 [Helicosporidium sp. ATCC 50920]|nr:hypothetical protein H632_c241p1 [Helicosporidium sp. ATCC 50920]|eukprot:KDD76398.1 hypothetical protein H632_c241p1 [Helicosporidium sp. ATCC 50920]
MRLASSRESRPSGALAPRIQRAAGQAMAMRSLTTTIYPRGSWEERVREMPGFVPGGPPLERSVFQSLEDWSPATPPSARDMAYWFTEPEGGWGPPTERAWVPAPQPEEEHRGDLARHVDGEGRRVVEELVVGQVLRGRIVGHHLRLGVQVDIGAEYDALLAINDVDFTGEHARWGGRESDERVEGFGGARSEILKPEAEKQQEPSSSSHASSTPPHSMPLDLQPQVDLGPWEEVQRALPLDTWLEVEIVALRLARVSDRCLFRFPVQALPRDASLRGLFPPAEEHRAPCDWRGLGLQSLEEMVQLSGRAARPIQAWEKSVRTQRVERALGHAVPDPGTPGSLALWTGEALEAWEAQHREAVQRKPWLREALRDPEVKRRLEEHFLGEDAPTAEAAGLEEGVEDDLAACGIASVSFFTEAAWDEEFSDEE